MRLYHLILPAVLLVLLAEMQAGEIRLVAPPVPPKPKNPALLETRTDRGLCVVVGVSEAVQLTNLTNQGWVLVQGLATSPELVTRTRRELVDGGANGVVTILQVASYVVLPYNANMVNLLVADMDTLGAQAPAEREILRVLAPGRGTAWLCKGGRWTALPKPLPA
jgi:hypothetical protein